MSALQVCRAVRRYQLFFRVGSRTPVLCAPTQASRCGHRAVSMLKLTDLIRTSTVWELDGAEPEPNYLELSLVSFIAIHCPFAQAILSGVC